MSGEGATTESWTVRKVLEWTIGYLRQNGSESPRLDGEILLAHARGCRRIQLYTQYDEPLTEAQRSTMRDLVRRRVAHEPVAYLVGRREFFSLEFVVTRDVLIPRPDTESLVMAALDLLKVRTSARVLDLCTGSGCIAIAVARNARQAQVVGVDVSPAAASVARQNVERLEVTERVQILEGDLFGPVAGQKFDVIVSNPPYITTAEMQALDPEVRQHEPHLALHGGADGLDFIRQIVAESGQSLEPNGWLLLELDPAQATPVTWLLKSAGFVNVSVINDLAGSARVVKGQLAVHQ